MCHLCPTECAVCITEKKNHCSDPFCVEWNYCSACDTKGANEEGDD